MKVFNLFFSIYRGLLYFLIGIFLCLCLGPLVVGIQPYITLSGSMSPEIEVGSLSFVQKKDSKSPFADLIEYKDYESGDIVAFKEGTDEESVMVIHRLVSENENGTWVTKGDANENEDISSIKESQIKGHFMYSIPKLGYAVSYLQTKQGIVVAVIFCAVALFSSFLTENTSVKTKKKEDNQPSEEDAHAGETSDEG